MVKRLFGFAQNVWIIVLCVYYTVENGLNERKGPGFGVWLRSRIVLEFYSYLVTLILAWSTTFVPPRPPAWSCANMHPIFRTWRTRSTSWSCATVYAPDRIHTWHTRSTFWCSVSLGTGHCCRTSRILIREEYSERVGSLVIGAVHIYPKSPALFFQMSRAPMA